MPTDEILAIRERLVDALGPGGAMAESGTLSVGEDGRIAFGG
jgi:hypothetical protein